MLSVWKVALKGEAIELPTVYPHHCFRVKTAIGHFTIEGRGAPGLKTHDAVRGVAPVPLAATDCSCF